MDLDTDKIDDAVVALLLRGPSGRRAWKGFDSETMDRLHERGFVGDTRPKSASLELTDEGLARAQQKLVELFGRSET